MGAEEEIGGGGGEHLLWGGERVGECYGWEGVEEARVRTCHACYVEEGCYCACGDGFRGGGRVGAGVVLGAAAESYMVED